MTAADTAPPPESEIDPTAIHPGARWWRLDIHAHSPASKDYGSEGRDTETGKPSFDMWLQAYIDAGIDGLVVTDHNTHAGIDDARKALDSLRESNADLPNLVLFPGVELTVTGGVHVLAIFDPETPSETIATLIARCRYNGTRGGSTETANITVVDAAKEINDLGGICVPAHADKNAGIFRRSDLDLPTLKQAPIRAVEIIDDAEVVKAERNNWVALLGSDAHFLTTDGCPEGQEPKAPGTHFTWVKAERLDLHGLNLALTDAKEAVVRGRIGSCDQNEASHGRIDHVIVRHRGDVETYSFNPWMNCLIGGRGVGKSTVLELIRLAMGRSGDLSTTVLATDLERFMPGAEPALRWWDESSSIEVRYTKGRAALRILWSGQDGVDTRVEAWNGLEWEPQAGKAADRAPIQVFSQKQIYELARQPQSFLAILDRMDQVRKSEWAEEYSSIEVQFRKAREDLRELMTETGRADRLRGQLQEVQGKLRHLEELRADARFNELETNETNLRRTTEAEKQATEIAAQLRGHAEALRSLSDAHQDISDYQGRTASFVDSATLIDAEATRLEAAASAWREANFEAQWTARIDELGMWLAAEGGQGQNLSAERTAADRQYEKDLQAALQEFEHVDEKLEEQRLKINELLEQLAAKRRELHERRDTFVKSLADDRTRVRVFHQGGIANIGDELREILNRPTSFDNAFDDDGLPKSLLDAEPKAPQFSQSVVPEFKADLIDLIRRGPESRIAERVRIDARFYRRADDAERFDLETNAMLWFPEDLVTVEYKPDGSGNFTPVDQGSPGQKTAALLAIILQMGNEPLLLDQPEDDLENKLIKHLTVETLKQIKRNRQLIVSTHNANVVVTSGAEQVLVIQHGEHLPGIEAAGTLQSEAVKQGVCLILEGGEEAIRTRYQRLVGTTN